MAGAGHYVAFVVVALAALAGGILVGRKVPAKRAGWVLGPFVLAAVLYAVCRARPEWEAALFPWPGYAYWQRQWVYPLGLFTLGVGDPFVPRPVWRRSEQVLEDWDGLVVLLCRTGPFDGQDAPFVGEWKPAAEKPEFWEK